MYFRHWRRIVFVVISILLLLGVYTRLSFSSPSVVQATYETCEQEQIPQKPTCWKHALATIAAKNNAELILSFFVRVANSDTRDCHTFAHDVGRLMYAHHKDDLSTFIAGTDIKILNYCSYGFWHGLVTAYSRDPASDVAQIRDFCEQTTLQYKRSADCFHGFGIGAIGDPPPSHAWGSARKMADAALETCARISSNSDYLEECYQGAFHQLFDYMTQKVYGLESATGDNPLEVCFEINDKYAHACLLQAGGSLYALSGFNLTQARDYLRRVERVAYFEEIFKATLMGATSMTIDEKLENLLIECRTMTSGKFCMESMVAAMVTKGNRINWLEKTIRFCGFAIGDEEKDTCYNDTAFGAKEVLSEQEFKKFCTDLAQDVKNCATQK